MLSVQEARLSGTFTGDGPTKSGYRRFSSARYYRHMWRHALKENSRLRQQLLDIKQQIEEIGRRAAPPAR